MKATRGQVLRFRAHAQQLAGAGAGDVAILDIGVQDTGPDGASRAMALRGGPPPADDLVLAWTLRGAPHYYRRTDVAAVAAAVRPWNEADAAKRIFDAAKPLRAAGIPILEALDHIATEMRALVTKPTVKGTVSRALSDGLEKPYLRSCRPCDAIHTYEQPFRLAALQGGLELEPDTSPPVLRRIKGWRGPARSVPEHLDPVRAVLRFLGPANPKLVAAFVDSPVKEVAARWPEDVVSVDVDGTTLDVLAADADTLAHPGAISGVRLLGPFDLFLQARDRELIVPDAAGRKDLWRVLGRPGGVLVGAEVCGSWRPRASGKKLRLQVTMWNGGKPPAALDEEAERLAAHRDMQFAGYETAG